jgi:hypothetical protein
MIAIEWPVLELSLFSYIVAANLLTIFIGVVERKLIKPAIYNYIYIVIIVSTLFIFFSAAIHSKYLGISGIIMVMCGYFLIAFIFAFIIYFELKQAGKGRRILREYKRGLKKKEKLKKNK